MGNSRTKCKNLYSKLIATSVEKVKKNVRELNDEDTLEKTEKEGAIKKYHEQLSNICYVDETFPTADMLVQLFDWSTFDKSLRENIVSEPKDLVENRERYDQRAKGEQEEESLEEDIGEEDDPEKELEKTKEKLAQQESTLWKDVMHLKSTRAYVEYVRVQGESDDFGLPDFLSEKKRSWGLKGK